MNPEFKDILALMHARAERIETPVVSSVALMDAQTAAGAARRESWQLLSSGIRHLHHGAPDGTQGSMEGALSLASLRSSSLAQSLGVQPPRFEPILLPVEKGTPPAVFLSTALVTLAEHDWVKSREVLHLHILNLKEEDVLKKQMAFTFNILTQSYADVCREFKNLLARSTTRA